MRKYNKTIFALSTPKQKSALGVFRISGKDSLKTINKITRNKKIKPYRTNLLKIYNSEKEIIDQTIIVFYKAPKSYTGEDLVEISCHGGLATIKKISSLLVENGLKPAEPGEFTKRALLNDKININEAESINDLVNSETEGQRKIAIRNLNGELDEYIEKLTSKLIKIIADTEAIIDFADEDLPPETLKTIKEQNKNIIKDIKGTIKQSNLASLMSSGFNITILGKPNTGKSSFINFINNKEVSIVTNIPGTTTDLVSCSLEINENKYTFFDTAGIRNYKNIIEKIGIQKSIEKAKNSNLNLVFLEKKEKTKYKNIPNKIFIKSKYDKTKKKYPDAHNISSITGYGISSLLRKIVKKTQNKITNETVFSRERHLLKLKNTLKILQNVDFKRIDTAAEDLRASLKEIKHINEKFDIEKILDIVFSDFCIGK